MNRAYFYLFAIGLHLLVLFCLSPQSDAGSSPKDEKKYVEVTLSVEPKKIPEPKESLDPGPIKNGPDSGPDEKPKAAALPAPLVDDSPPPAPIGAPIPPPPEPDPEPPPPTVAPTPVVSTETPLKEAPPLPAPVAARTLPSVVSQTPGNAVGLPVSGTGNGNAAEWSRGSGGNGHFYRAFAVPNGINWDDANQYAESHGSYLATIESAEENNFVFKLVDDKKYWFFNSPTGANLGPWLGGVRSLKSIRPNLGWSWNNSGKSFTYTHWSPTQPDNNGNSENRLHFYAHLTTDRLPNWNDLNPGRLLHGFVVEYDTEAAYLADHAEFNPITPKLPLRNPAAPIIRH